MKVVTNAKERSRSNLMARYKQPLAALSIIGAMFALTPAPSAAASTRTTLGRGDSRSSPSLKSSEQINLDAPLNPQAGTVLINLASSNGSGVAYSDDLLVDFEAGNN